MYNQINLWRHQKAAVAFLQSRVQPYGALWMGVGTGKTRTTLAFVQQRGYKRVLILVSKKGYSAWVGETEKVRWQAPVINLTEGKTVDRAETLNTLRSSPEFVLILNYDVLTLAPIQRALLKMEFDIVVADEAQRIGGHSSKRSLFTTQLKTKYRLALSGTPFQDIPLDVFGIARFLSPMVEWGKVHSAHFGTWTHFKNEYAYWRGEHDMILVGYHDIPTLGKIVSEFSFIVDRKEVLDLPPENFVVEKLKLDVRAEADYRRFEKTFVLQLTEGKMVAERKVTQLIRLQQFTGGTAVLVDHNNQEVKQVVSSTVKVERLKELVEEIGNEPIVIFYRFNSDLDRIVAGLSTTRKVYQVNGGHDERSWWEEQPDGILLVQMSAGSEAIDLTHSRYAIYYSLDWSSGKYQQSIGRISRPTQKASSTTFIHLLIEDSVDEDIYEAIQNKVVTNTNILKRMANRYGRDLGSEDELPVG